jgi:tetratricopeptide (TPR) repeat protein
VSRTVRRAALAAAVLFVGVAAIPAWESVRLAIYLSKAGSLRDAPEEAITPLLTAVEIAPDRAEVQFLVGKTYRRMGRFDKAAWHLDRARRLGWPEEDVLREQLLGSIQAGDIDRLVPQVQELLSSDLPDDMAEEAYEAMVKGYLGTYRMIEAIPVLDYWVEWRPQSKQPRLWLADIGERLLKHDEAIGQYREILKFEPECVEARAKLARMLLQRNQVDEALAEYQKCKPEEPARQFDVQIGIAECYYRLGDQNTAIAEQMLEKLLQSGELAGQQEMRALTLMCQVLLQDPTAAGQDVFERVVQMASRALDIDPFSIETHYVLAQGLNFLDRKDEANLHLKRHRELRQTMRNVAEKSRDLVKNPANVQIRYELGLLVYDQGSTAEASVWWESCLNYDPDYLPAHQKLAQYYRDTGNAAKAAKHAAKAKALEERQEAAAGQAQPAEPPAGQEPAGEPAAQEPAPAEPAEGQASPAAAGSSTLTDLSPAAKGESSGDAGDAP